VRRNFRPVGDTRGRVRNPNQRREPWFRIEFGKRRFILGPLAENGHIRIKDLPAHERPRERLVENGAETLKTSELLAILLRTGSKGVSAMDLGERLLQQFGTLDKLARAPLPELQKVRGIGPDKAIALKSAFTLAQRMAQEIRHDSPVLDRPDFVADLFREEARFQPVETFHVLLLNTRRRLIRMEKISQGTLDTLLVHPREVFKAAISANAAAVVLVHNHPSGDPTPSEGDIRVTRDLIRAGQLLKIDVLDHVIIGARSQDRAKDYVSLKELGYFYS
jgi:DNA repair protein RadC